MRNALLLCFALAISCASYSQTSLFVSGESRSDNVYDRFDNDRTFTKFAYSSEPTFGLTLILSSKKNEYQIDALYSRQTLDYDVEQFFLNASFASNSSHVLLKLDLNITRNWWIFETHGIDGYLGLGAALDFNRVLSSSAQGYRFELVEMTDEKGDTVFIPAPVNWQTTEANNGAISDAMISLRTSFSLRYSIRESINLRLSLSPEFGFTKLITENEFVQNSLYGIGLGLSAGFRL